MFWQTMTYSMRYRKFSIKRTPSNKGTHLFFTTLNIQVQEIPQIDTRKTLIIFQYSKQMFCYPKINGNNKSTPLGTAWALGALNREFTVGGNFGPTVHPCLKKIITPQEVVYIVACQPGGVSSMRILYRLVQSSLKSTSTKTSNGNN